MEPIQHQQLTPIGIQQSMNSTNPIPVIPVDMHGAPMLDAATGHPLVAAPVQQQQVLSQPVVKQSQVQYLAGGDMGLYTVQPGAPLQLMAQVPAMLAQQPQQQQVCILNKHKLNTIQK